MRFRLALAFVALLIATSPTYGQSVPFASTSLVGGFFVMLLWVGAGAVAFVEWKMNSSRDRRYLSSGVPVFCLEQFCSDISSRLPDLERLFSRTRVRALPNIRFEKIAPDEYVFAEEFGVRESRFNYGPIMRGLVTFDGECSRIVVKGMINYFPVAIALAWFFTFGFTPLGLTLVSIVILVYVYQAIRYFHVTKAVADAWAEEDDF